MQDGLGAWCEKQTEGVPGSWCEGRGSGSGTSAPQTPGHRTPTGASAPRGTAGRGWDAGGPGPSPRASLPMTPERDGETAKSREKDGERGPSQGKGTD